MINKPFLCFNSSFDDNHIETFIIYIWRFWRGVCGNILVDSLVCLYLCMFCNLLVFYMLYEETRNSSENRSGVHHTRVHFHYLLLVYILLCSVYTVHVNYKHWFTYNIHIHNTYICAVFSHSPDRTETDRHICKSEEINARSFVQMCIVAFF